MLSINTNLSSLIAQSSMKTSTELLNQAVERMTTGLKINHAKDNAANYSISTNMTTQISSYMIAEDNVSTGLDMLSTASDTISQMLDKASRLQALSTQSRNGTYGKQSLEAMNAEAGALISEIERIFATAKFNGISLLDKVTEQTASMQAGLSSEIVLDPIEYTQEIVEEVPDVVVTNPAQLSSAISNNTKIGIANAETLAKLAELVNSGTTCSGKTIILTEDIDLSSYDNWTSIGISGRPFRGVFNGNGHTITNLKIDKTTSYQGLFGYSFGDIKNVNVNIAEIVSTNNYVGTIVGYTTKAVSNCHISNAKIVGQDYVGGIIGRASMGNITYCSAPNVSVEGQESVGGIVGSAKICTNSAVLSGSINCSYLNAGGLAGTIDEIRYCFSNADVLSESQLGGLVGWLYDNIENCYATGEVNSLTVNAGGLIGVSDNASVSNCYSLSNVTAGGQNVGGLIGYATSGTILNCYATGQINGGWAIGGLIGQSSANVSNSYAVGDVTSNQTGASGGLIGHFNGSLSNCYATGDVVNLNPDAAVSGGLVGDWKSGALITQSYATGDVIGGSMLGGFLGKAQHDGTASSPKVLNIVDCYSTGDVSGSRSIGGFAGGTLDYNGFATNEVNFEDCISFGKVECVDGGGSFLGGILNAPNNESSYSTVTITNCKSLSQGIETVGKCYKWGTSPYPESSYDCSVQRAGVSEFDLDTTLQVGIHSNTSSQISVNTDISYSAVKSLGGLTFRGLNSDKTLDIITNFINLLSEAETNIGAAQNKLESALDEVSIQYENLVSSRSTMRDADIAEVSSQYIQQQILQQAAATLMSTANQSPSIALQLI